MSTDREEIRWKFQIIGELISIAIDALENERKIYDDLSLRIEKSLVDKRNEWLSGIGFGVTTVFILMGLDIIDKIHIIYPLIAIFGGIVIFVVYGWYISKIETKLLLLTSKFRDLYTNEMLPLRGMISRYALDENITREQMWLILGYVTVYAQAVSYELGNYGHQLFKNAKKPTREVFQGSYEIAKNNLDQFKKFGFHLRTTRIEKYVSDFESNQK